MSQSPYSPPVPVSRLEECYFYHAVELPEYGLTNGEWDLRGGVDAYLGGVSVAGKRVLEVGTADGFLCFEMEKRGADVVAYDLSDKDDWDIVPYGGYLPEEQIADRKKHMRRINQAWWFSHKLHRSKAKVVYGTVYNLPPAIGKVNISTFGSILLHLRDPFGALSKAAPLTTETMIVTDMVPDHPLPLMFVPDPDRREPCETWWTLSSDIIVRFLRVLGFNYCTVTHHTQTCRGAPVNLYTVVGRRHQA